MPLKVITCLESYIATPNYWKVNPMNFKHIKKLSLFNQLPIIIAADGGHRDEESNLFSNGNVPIESIILPSMSIRINL